MQHSIRRRSARYGFAIIGALLASACAGLVSDQSSPPLTASADETVLSSSSRHAEGLDEDVVLEVVHRGPSGTLKRVRRADGHYQGIAEYRRDERDAHHQRFGTITREVWDQLRRCHPDGKLAVALQFAPPVDWNDLGPRLQSSSAEIYGAARTELRDQIAGRAAVLTGEVQRLGATRVSHSASIPYLYLRGSPFTIIAASLLDGIIAVIDNEPAVATFVANGPTPDGDPAQPSPPDSISDGLLTSFNNQGYFGAGQHVAVVEGPFCGWFAGSLFTPGQTEFSFNNITYQRAPLHCQSLGDCNACARGLGLAIPFACVDFGLGFGEGGGCVEEHASQCAGVIAGSTNHQHQGASDSWLYFPNGGVTSDPDATNPGVACQTEGVADAYDWLAQSEQNVTTTSESFVCNPGDGDGATQDWYARYFSMSIFRAAGNNQFISTEEACRGLNINCVGGNTIADVMWASSTWINPPNSDREEPDMTALAHAVDVQTFATANGLTSNASTFGQEDGTSFAAPAMASMAALLKESQGGFAQPQFVRAVMRTAAWSKNPDPAWTYSTPIAGFDHKDGAGEPTGDNILLFSPYYDAPAGTPTVRTGSFGVYLPSPEAPLPSFIDQSGVVPPDDSTFPTFKPTGRWGGALFVATLNAGDRIRMTFTWDSCPAMTGSAQPAVASDFDIFLCDAERPYCYPLASSQSFDDNNEGFDTTVPSAASWEAWYGVYPEATGCQGQVYEGVTWAAAYGPPAAFQSDPPPGSQ